MAESRIYCARDKSGKRRLVRATHPSNVYMHVARSDYDVSVASQEDLEELLPKGTLVEKIRAEQQELGT